MSDTIIVLDYGSQYAQLIARRVRELQVYCELFHWNTPQEEILALQPKGFILSGGPASVYEANAPTLPDYVLNSGLPVLGICYGMQLLTHALGGKVAPGSEREYGDAQVEVDVENPLIKPGTYQVWMSHGDRVEQIPPDFKLLGKSANSPAGRHGQTLNAGYSASSFILKFTTRRQAAKSCRTLWFPCAACVPTGHPRISLTNRLKPSGSR